MATIQGITLRCLAVRLTRQASPSSNEQTNNGADLTAIGDLAATDEYQDRFDGLNNVQIVTKIYQDLFGRDRTQLAWQAFFVAALNAGTLDINTVAINILDGARATTLPLLQTRSHRLTSPPLQSTPLSKSVLTSVTTLQPAGRNFLSGITADEATVKTAEQAATAVQDIVDAGVAGKTSAFWMQRAWSLATTSI